MIPRGNASVSLYKETLSEFEQGPVQKSNRVHGWEDEKSFGKCSPKLNAMKGVSFAAKVLFDSFAAHGKGHEIVALSNGFLAASIGGSRGTVITALRELEQLCVIEKYGTPTKRDQVQAYRMLHHFLFRRETPKTEAKPKERKQVDLGKCVKCRAKCMPDKSGMCRKCIRVSETRQIARQEAKVVVSERLAGDNKEERP